MEIIIQPNADSVCRYAARQIAELVKRKPDAVLGLATGSSPVRLYAELIRLHREEGLDFQRVTTFNLDEYVGLPPSHLSSYRHFMRVNLFDHLNLDPARTFVPPGLVAGEEIKEACEKYEEEIRLAGGIDLQILGIGSDGHIGFNEPSSSLASRTRIKTLTQRTRQDNAAFFKTAGEVPHHVITMGIGTIMEAKRILLLAFGESKAQAVSGCVEGPIGASLPASILQMHPRAAVLLDEGAAQNLRRREYYRWVFAHKPSGQA